MLFRSGIQVNRIIIDILGCTRRNVDPVDRVGSICIRCAQVADEVVKNVVGRSSAGIDAINDGTGAVGRDVVNIILIEIICGSGRCIQAINESGSATGCSRAVDVVYGVPADGVS